MAQTGYTPILIYSSSTGGNAPAAGNLTNSTLGSELAINITDGKLFYKDNANTVQVIGWKVVPATAGGTGQTVYAVGDILYANTATTLAKLADVATGNALISGGIGVAPSWGKIGLTTHVSGTLPIANGGTNQTSFTSPSSSIAGLVWFDGTSFQNDATTSHVGYNATTNTFYANNVNFSGTVTLASALPVAQGGTGLTSFTANSVFYASSTSAIGQSANLTFDGTVLTVNGAGTNQFLKLSRSVSAAGSGYIFANSNNMFGVTDGTLYPFLVNQGAPTNSLIIGTSGGVSVGNSTDPGAGNLLTNGSYTYLGTTAAPSNEKSGNKYLSLGGMVMESIENIQVGTSSTQITKNGAYGLLVFITANQGGYNYNAILLCTANGGVTVVSAPNSLGYGQTVSYSMGGPYNGQLFMSVSGTTGGNLYVNGMAFSINRN